MKHTSPKTRIAAVALALGLALTGCSSPDNEMSDQSSHSESPQVTASSESSATNGGHAGHSADGGDPPAGIEKTADPKFAVGDTLKLSADHMPGMKGAEAIVSGAFDTTTYSVSYTSADGGDPVRDHKWVVHEELKDPAEAPLKKGTKVDLEAEHMPGMKGAEATIDSATDETVYMVDVKMDGMEMTNHKWVVESEMQAAQ